MNQRQQTHIYILLYTSWQFSDCNYTHLEFLGIRMEGNLPTHRERCLKNLRCTFSNENRLLMSNITKSGEKFVWMQNPQLGMKFITQHIQRKMSNLNNNWVNWISVKFFRRNSVRSSDFPDFWNSTAAKRSSTLFPLPFNAVCSIEIH